MAAKKTTKKNEHKSFGRAVLEARREVGPIIKGEVANVVDQLNTDVEYRFAGSEATVEQAVQTMLSHGLVFSVHSTRLRFRGKERPVAVVELKCSMEHVDSCTIRNYSFEMPAPHHMDQDKAVAAASTYGRGQAIRLILSLTKTEDESYSPDRRTDTSGEFSFENPDQLRRGDAKPAPKPAAMPKSPKDDPKELSAAQERLNKCLTEWKALGESHTFGLAASSALGCSANQVRGVANILAVAKWIENDTERTRALNATLDAEGQR